MKGVRARRTAALLGIPLWFSLRRTRPVSDDWGFDRGTPIDRFYFEEFLQEHRDLVHGDVLDLKDARYATRLGEERLTRAHVLDVDDSNPEATVIADLAKEESLPAEAYDCVLLMQALQVIRRPEVALANVWRSLKPGGALLLTVPSVSKLDVVRDLWRFTPAGIEELVSATCPSGEADVRGYGNVLACSAFLHGLAAEELRPDDLRRHDPDFPLVVCARVSKSASQSQLTHSPPRAPS
jgi:SAM-dependent methyltransferase